MSYHIDTINVTIALEDKVEGCWHIPSPEVCFLLLYLKKVLNIYGDKDEPTVFNIQCWRSFVILCSVWQLTAAKARSVCWPDSNKRYFWKRADIKKSWHVVLSTLLRLGIIVHQQATILLLLSTSCLHVILL